MALGLNGTNQHLTIPWSTNANQPLTMASWAVRGSVNNYGAICAVGDSAAVLNFHALQAFASDGGGTKAISFDNYAEANAAALNTSLHCLIARFNPVANTCSIEVDGVLTSVPWSEAAHVYDQIRVGRTISTDGGILEYYNGLVGYVTVWQEILSDADGDAYRLQTENPLNLGTTDPVVYLPFENDLLDYSTSARTVTGYNLSSPTFTAIAVSYPAAAETLEAAVTQSARPATQSAGVTTTPGTLSAAIAQSAAPATQAVQGYANQSAAMTQTAHAASQAVSTVPIPVNRIVDHTNFDASALSNAQVIAAAGVRVYFEHASTGQDVVGNSDTDSSTGLNQDETADCGLAQLYDEDSRFLCDRESFVNSNDSTWFATHTGLQSNMRGNPTPALKLSGFVGMSSAMANAIDVGTEKSCWIDFWDGSGWDDATPGYIADGAAFVAGMITAIETWESTYGKTFLWWTFPLQTTESYPQRTIANTAVRAYCSANNRPLIDIAALESHDPDGNPVVDGNGRECAYDPYMMPDGGHLDAAGRLRLANAWWVVMAMIAADLEVDTLNAAVTQTAHAASQASAAQIIQSGAVAQTARPAAQSAAGQVIQGGAVAQSARPATQALSGYAGQSAAITQSASPAIQAAQESSEFSATIAQVAAPATQAAAGTVRLSGAIAQAARPASQAAQGYAIQSAAAAQAARPAVQAVGAYSGNQPVETAQITQAAVPARQSSLVNYVPEYSGTVEVVMLMDAEIPVLLNLEVTL